MSDIIDDKHTDNKEVTPFALQFAEEIEGTLEDLERKYNTGSPETLPPPVD